MAGELGFDTGPYVTAASFCEKVLQEKDGVITLVRMIDQINVQAQGPLVPNEMPPGNVQVTLAVMLKAGDALGAQRLQVSLHNPDSSTVNGPENSINFSAGKNGGANVIMPMLIEVKSAGLYWADIRINDRLISRIPLQINYGFTRVPIPVQGES